MGDEDLERMRRSLTMAPSLPAGEAEALLREVGERRRTHRDLVAVLDALSHQIDRLRALAKE